MSKKIDRALDDLVKALTKHAQVAGDSTSSTVKLKRAAAKVRATATSYGVLISARRGTDSPFSDIPDPRLDEPTVVSLRAERDALLERRLGKAAPKPEAPTAEPPNAESPNAESPAPDAAEPGAAERDAAVS